jgi:predicted N-acyltransferase
VKFEIQLAHSVEEVGQEGWDRLSGRRPFASYRWYRFGERVLRDETPSYLILSLGGEPVARATFWLQREEPIAMPGTILQRALQVAWRRWPLLLCRSPLSSTSGLILPDDPQLRPAALQTITRFAQDQAQRQRVSFVVFDYLEQHETQGPAWPEAFMPATIPNPGTRLTITWPDFETYLAQLSRKRRKHYRQHCRRAAEMGVEIKLQRAATDVETALGLVRNVAGHHGQPLASWTGRLLENAGMVDGAWLAAEVEGRLVGCELLLGDQGTWFVTALGRDYAFEHVYFLLGYADIRFAIEQGVQVLRWGSCAHDVKRRLGFQPESNHHLSFAASNRGLRWMAQKLVAVVQ